MSADIDEDVPPLEDMSEELERIKSRIAQSKRVERSDIMQPPRQQDASLNPTMSVSGSESKQATKGRSQTERVKEKTASAGDTKSSSFGGFKKGFLVSSSDSSKPRPKREPPAPSKKTTPAAASSVKETGSENESDIPFIRPKDKVQSSLEFPEVQQAMKEAFPLLQSKDWVTDDLLSKIHDNPVLSEAFSDPALGQVLTQLQSNPQAVAAAAKDSPKIQKFVQEFCALMGDHFTMLADKDEKDNTAAATDTPHISEAKMSGAEEAEMREIISRPPVKEALSDPRVEQLIISLKDDPPEAQRLLRSGDEDFQRKVKVLIDNELVSFQSFS